MEAKRVQGVPLQGLLGPLVQLLLQHWQPPPRNSPKRMSGKVPSCYFEIDYEKIFWGQLRPGSSLLRNTNALSGLKSDLDRYYYNVFSLPSLIPSTCSN